MTVKTTLVFELAISGDFTLQRPLLPVVQPALPDAPPLHSPATFAFGMRRSFESCAAMLIVALHLLPVHAELASRSPMWTLPGTGVRVGVLVGVEVSVLVAVSVGVSVGLAVSVGVLVAVGVRVFVGVLVAV